MPACPSCGKTNASSVKECAYCGVVFSKWAKHAKMKKALGALPPAPVALKAPRDPGVRRRRVRMALAVAALAAGIFYYRNYFTFSLDAGETGFPFFSGGRIGFINVQGRLVSRAVYDAGELFSEGMAAVKRDRLWGYVNSRGVLAIPCRYYRAGPFSEGVALAQLPTGEWEIITAAGVALGSTNLNPVLGKDYEVSTFHNGRARVMDPAGKFVFINTSGKAVGGLYDAAMDFSEGMAFCRPLGSPVWSYIGTNGRPALAATFLRGGPFSEGLAPAEKVEGRSQPGVGYIDRTGDYVIRPLYGNAEPFHNGLAWVQTLQGVCQVIDRNGRGVFKLACSDLRADFSDRLTPFYDARLKKYGALDRDGTIRLPAAFAIPPVFKGGLAFVAVEEGENSRAGYVDEWGDMVWAVPLRDVRGRLDDVLERRLGDFRFGEQILNAVKRLDAEYP